MYYEELIAAVREDGAKTDAEVLAVLNKGKDSKYLSGLLCLWPLDPNRSVCCGQHSDAEDLIQEAHGFIVKSIRLADLKKSANLPEIATINGRAVSLNWQPNCLRDGWYAEVDPGVLRELGVDNLITMQEVEKELAQYGDNARYHEDPRDIEVPYLCVYKDAV